MWRQHPTEPLLSPQGTIKVCTSHHCTSQGHHWLVHHWLFFFTSSWVTAKSQAVSGPLSCWKKRVVHCCWAWPVQVCCGIPDPPGCKAGNGLFIRPSIHSFTPFIHLSPLCAGTELSPEVQRSNHNRLNPHYLRIQLWRNLKYKLNVSTPQQFVNTEGEGY